MNLRHIINRKLKMVINRKKADTETEVEEDDDEEEKPEESLE